MVINIKENDIFEYAICRDKMTAESIETIEMRKDEMTKHLKY